MSDAKKPPVLCFTDFAFVYCDRQEQTESGLRFILREQIERYQPDGFMLLECHMLDSSHCGNLVILPYGGTATYKEVPNHPISPRGLASDMSVVIATTTADGLEAPAPEDIGALIETAGQSGDIIHAVMRRGLESRQLVAEAWCRQLADTQRKKVRFGIHTFNPRGKA